MEINEENLRGLAQYLQQTLSPDPTIRRPGNFYCTIFYFLSPFLRRSIQTGYV